MNPTVDTLLKQALKLGPEDRSPATLRGLLRYARNDGKSPNPEGHYLVHLFLTKKYFLLFILLHYSYLVALKNENPAQHKHCSLLSNNSSQ